MTFDERVQAVAKKGFTERQARFLTTVMLHAGVCVPRQYARFCRHRPRAEDAEVFRQARAARYASMYDCRHNRARIYHVNQRALYAAIGEADSRLRRPLTLNHAIQRLMVLDAIVEDPDLVWLGTAEEKAAHLMTLTRIDQSTCLTSPSARVNARAVRYFPERLPIGIHLAGRGVLVYVVTDPWLDEFRVFLERHAALLRALPAWTLRIVVPPQFPASVERAKQVVWNQLLTPLRARDDRRTALVLRAGPNAIPRRLAATTSTSGSTVPATPSQRLGSRRCTGCGSRTATCALWGRIARNRSRRGRRRRPGRDARARSPIRPSLSLGQRCVKHSRAGQLRDKFGSSNSSLPAGRGGRGGRTCAKARLAPLLTFPTEETPRHLDCASAAVVAVTASIRECCRTIGSVLGRRSVPPVQPPARGTVTVMGREPSVDTQNRPLIDT